MTGQTCFMDVSESYIDNFGYPAYAALIEECLGREDTPEQVADLMERETKAASNG